ncbi:MAG TPA: serine hydroxymethyltransferase [Anaerolineales bacterium]
MSDFLFRGELKDLDPAIHELTQLEAERQYRRLILIPSESTAPAAVREALASAFNNIYAEGYPPESTRREPERQLLDYELQLAHYRRYSDPRYYKGVEYADVVESLARRRCAELFAANGLQPDDLFVNVQPLSGAPANNAVYHALVEPGETILGMDLMQGGHLTHGSRVNRSGKLYKSVHYGVDPLTERIDYDQVEALAKQYRPKLIIAGYSSYPWAPDWARFKQIAEAVGAFLLADIAHIAGPIAAGVLPSPVGFADVVTFTTHKSLCGPRGAVAITHHQQLAVKLDRAVFPGEQGGPHMNTIAAQAVAFKLAATAEFRELQQQILANCKLLSETLANAGLRIPFGGTNTHLTNVDVTTIRGPDGTSLSGDQAARILDLAGIVVNRNTIPGDTTAARPSGIRLGTVWVTQRGLSLQGSEQLGRLIARLLLACTPYGLSGKGDPLARAKVDYEVLASVQREVRDLATGLGIDFDPPQHGYPHFSYTDDPTPREPFVSVAVEGNSAGAFLRYVTEARPQEDEQGRSISTRLHSPGGPREAVLQPIEGLAWKLAFASEGSSAVVGWLRALSDGYVTFDADDLHRKPPGPVIVRVEGGLPALPNAEPGPDGSDKPWYVGAPADGGRPLPAFEWDEPERPELRRTPLYEAHRALGAKLIPFAGWEMPVWYSSVRKEHDATRQGAGLFDVSHMGVYQIEGPRAESFLDSVVANDVASLALGESLYCHLLDPEGRVLDDAMVYRRAEQSYLMVVNAANDDKVWAWLQAVRDGQVRVDLERPGSVAYGRGCSLRNLRDPNEGDQRRVDLALQGPHSLKILLGLGCSEADAARLKSLPWAGLLEGVFAGMDLIVSRTGYTGERVAFELFVHPDQCARLWDRLLEVGGPLGLQPAGLGARDSLRTEAGLPLYGQELAGERNLGIGDAGFAAYSKTYKPWFIGRSSFLGQEAIRKSEVARFRFDEKGVRMAHYGDPVVDREGRPIGFVTSCAIDSDGRLTGQAHLSRAHTAVGTPLGIFQGRGPAAKAFPDPALAATPATVVVRFPRF